MRISSAQFVLVVEASFWLLNGRLRAENWFIVFHRNIEAVHFFMVDLTLFAIRCRELYDL